MRMITFGLLNKLLISELIFWNTFISAGWVADDTLDIFWKVSAILFSEREWLLIAEIEITKSNAAAEIAFFRFEWFMFVFLICLKLYKDETIPFA